MKIHLSNDRGRVCVPTITFFDFETTGKEPAIHEILTGHFRTVDADTRKEIETLDIKMKPRKYIQEAFEIHGISEEEASRFPEKKDMMREVFRYLSRHSDSLFICHANYVTFGVRGYFDWQILKSECLYMDILHHFKDLFQNIDIYSTHTMARDRKLPVKKYSLPVLAEFIGFKYKAHNAKEDVQATEALFWHISEDNNLLTLMEE